MTIMKMSTGRILVNIKRLALALALVAIIPAILGYAASRWVDHADSGNILGRQHQLRPSAIQAVHSLWSYQAETGEGQDRRISVLSGAPLDARKGALNAKT
jgi:hypothetical protein